MPVSPETTAGAGDDPSPSPAVHHPASEIVQQAPVAGLVACRKCGREVPSADGVNVYGHLRYQPGLSRTWRRVPCPDETTPRIGDVQRGMTARESRG